MPLKQLSLENFGAMSQLSFVESMAAEGDAPMTQTEAESWGLAIGNAAARLVLKNLASRLAGSSYMWVQISFDFVG